MSPDCSLFVSYDVYQIIHFPLYVQTTSSHEKRICIFRVKFGGKHVGVKPKIYLVTEVITIRPIRTESIVIHDEW